jgi:putative transposase
MSDARSPRLGHVVRWNGYPWKVDYAHEDGLDLVNLMTGEKQTWSLASWFGAWQTRELELPGTPEPLDRRRPSKGSFMRRDDLVWRVRTVRGGLIHLEDERTGEVSSLKLEDWQRECWEGTTEMVDSPNAALPESIRELLRVPLDGLSATMRAAVEHAVVFVNAYRDPDGFYRDFMPGVPSAERVRPKGKRSKPRLEPFLRLVAEATGLPKPGFSTFCKWMTKVDVADGDIRALAPRYDRRGPHERTMPAVVEQWLIEAITALWLTRKENPKRMVWERLDKKVRTWNEENPHQQLVCPTKSHVCRYIREEVDRYAAVRARKGKAVADGEFRAPGNGVVTTFPLERVEVDHFRLSGLEAIDPKTGLNLGTPWASLAYDHYTKMPLSLVVQFEGETLGAVFRCLKLVMTPKDWLRTTVPNLDYEFPSGVPVSFFFDRASASDTDHVRAAASVLNIIMDYAVGENPQMKGSIERFIRTTREANFKPLVGPKKTEFAAGGKQQKVLIRLDVLERRLWNWVAMIYAKDWHGGIGEAPLHRWQRTICSRLPRALRRREDLTILLTRSEERFIRRGTVSLDGLEYKGLPLRAIASHPGYRPDMPVVIRYDEFDVGDAWVVNPFTGEITALEPSDRALMCGLSRHQHDRTLKHLGNRKKAYDTADLRDAKLAMMDEAIELLASQSRLSGEARAQAARFAKQGAHGLSPDIPTDEPETLPPGTDGAADGDVAPAERKPRIVQRRRHPIAED